MVAMCWLPIGSVNERPKSFGGLQLGTIRRQINEANTIGDFEIGWPMPSRIVEHEQDDAAQARASRPRLRKGFEQSLEGIPSTRRWETYQKVSPVAGDTNAVT